MNIRFKPREKAASDLMCLVDELKECRRRKPGLWRHVVKNIFKIDPEYLRIVKHSRPCDSWLFRLYLNRNEYENRI